MKKFIKECTTCYGTGKMGSNNSWDNHPSRDESWPCDYCEDGQVHDQDALEEAIDDVEYMIEGMLTRIRCTSYNIKLSAKLDCTNLVARHKNTLHTQARALARLEMYKANLQNL